MKILIVEDNEDSRVLLHDMLTSSGYEVKSAENGKKALKKIGENFLPDLIISDILMPEMDGYALCRALKGDDSFRSIPFIFYTATYTDPRDEKFAMSLGAARFLIKPMEMPEFLQEIKLVLEEYKGGGLSVRQSSGKNEHEVEKKYSEVLGRKLDKKVRELEEQNQRLQKYADRQAVLVQEINHRVRNNLIAIINILHQEEDRANAELPESRSEPGVRLQGVVRRINGLLTLHSLLSATQWVPLSLSQLSQSIVQEVFKEVAADKSINLDVSPSDVHINSDQAHYLTIVLNELATNTIKHALQGRDTANIQVSIQYQDDDLIHLVYHDDGPGFPEFVLGGKFPKTCIGFHLIFGIIKQSLQGEVELLNDSGAMVKITFPEVFNSDSDKQNKDYQDKARPI